MVKLMSIRSCLIFILSAYVNFQTLAGTNYFLVGPTPGSSQPRDSLVIPLTKAEDLTHARDLILRYPEFDGGTNRPIVVARVVAGRNGINRNYLNPKFPEWSWHVQEVLGFYDIVIEEIMFDPTYLETHFDWSVSGKEMIVGFAGYGYSVVKELGPTPLYSSILLASSGLELYWSSPGIQYVFTVETARDNGSWEPLAGVFWPQLTNRWTLQSNLSNAIFRVKAELPAP